MLATAASYVLRAEGVVAAGLLKSWRAAFPTKDTCTAEDLCCAPAMGAHRRILTTLDASQSTDRT
ncbi:MAG: hypothetical protein WKF84_19920 [Pyrinomonadaceae bacterium]